MASVDLKTARLAKRHLASDLAGKPNIAGIGIKPVADGFALKVNLLTETPGLALPADVDGVDLYVEVSGPGVPDTA